MCDMEGGNKCSMHGSGQKAYNHVYAYICICACISGFCPGLLECQQPFSFVCNKGTNISCGAGCPTQNRLGRYCTFAKMPS